MSDSLQPCRRAIACQAPLSMEFSRQEYWSGLPFPSPGESLTEDVFEQKICKKKKKKKERKKEKDSTTVSVNNFPQRITI